MKKFIIIVLILFMIKSYSQSGRVFYSATIDLKGINTNTDTDSIAEKEFKETLIKILSDIKPINYILEFNSHQSFFEKKVNLENDSKTINITKYYSGSSEVYCDLNKKIILEKINSFGENFLIQDHIDSIKWKLLKESKKIGKYTCFKATTVKKMKNNNGVFFRKVTAWYTPEIHFRFGPKKYCNLPGLILELVEGKLTFKATQIVLNNKEFEISKPTKGKKITQEEFINIAKGAMEGLKNR